MGRTNAAWHRDNRMPANPTMDQRIAWHVAHAQACRCRAIPEMLLDEVRRRGIDVPAFRGHDQDGRD